MTSINKTEIEDTIQRVREAKKNAGDQPWLLAYDANGIQHFVTSSSRPMGMRGASEIIKRFDNEAPAKTNCPAEKIFTGGGRGQLLLPGEQAATEAVEKLQSFYRQQTHGGSLAVALAPLILSNEAASLRWLQQRMQLAKDEAPAPYGPQPGARSGMSLCEDCGQDLGTIESERTGSTGKVCLRCRKIARVGRQVIRPEDENRQLGDLSINNRLVAISADGNNMGPLFSTLDTLEDMALLSHAVNLIFKTAVKEAKEKVPSQNRIVLVTGGDDVRAFIAPEYLLTFIEKLTESVEARAKQFSEFDQRLKKLDGIGIGIGAVMASATYPASELMGYAHQMEVSAKRICRPDQTNAARSAFDYLNLSSGDELRQKRSRRTEGPIDMRTWSNRRERLNALSEHVPKSQRQSILDAREKMDCEEFAQFFRYQVARSNGWKEYCECVKIGWQDLAEVSAAAPTRQDHELARLLEFEQTHRR